MKKVCDSCERPAVYHDSVYGPPMVFTCDEWECIKEAALNLWEWSHEEVVE